VRLAGLSRDPDAFHHYLDSRGACTSPNFSPSKPGIPPAYSSRDQHRFPLRILPGPAVFFLLAASEQFV
jgi:hypothetical protein